MPFSILVENSLVLSKFLGHFLAEIGQEGLEKLACPGVGVLPPPNVTKPEPTLVLHFSDKSMIVVRVILEVAFMRDNTRRL